MTHDVQAGELDGGMQLRAVVVEAGRGVADLEAQGFEVHWVVAFEVVGEATDRGFRTFTAPAKLTQAH